MKGFFFAGFIFFAVLILILAFENIGARFQYFLFFFSYLDQSINPFFIVLGVSMLGGIAGIFLTVFVSQFMKSGQEDEEPPGSEF